MMILVLTTAKGVRYGSAVVDDVVPRKREKEADAWSVSFLPRMFC